jgi:1,4-dihydroxy-2-naphthoate octaprenyltransferase
MAPKNKLHVWVLAARPKTLPAAAAPVIVGAALAVNAGQWQWLPALATLCGALLLQIGSNLANDVFDYEKGTDSGERLGPLRVTQSGWLTPAEVKRAMWIIFGMAMLLGIYLYFFAGWVILVIGLAAILSAIAYTGGPFPLGYHGLGDLFVFIFFGLVATVGTYYIQTGTTTSTVWWMGTAIGLLIVNVLVVNNLRDLDGDRIAGKQTLAVRLGQKGTRTEYWIGMSGAYTIPIFLWLYGNLTIGSLAVVLSMPLALRLVRSIYHDIGIELNKTLAATGQLCLIYALLFATGIRWY